MGELFIVLGVLVKLNMYNKEIGGTFGFWVILVGPLFLLLSNGSVTLSVGGLAFDKILVMDEIHVFAAVQTFSYSCGS